MNTSSRCRIHSPGNETFLQGSIQTAVEIKATLKYVEVTITSQFRSPSAANTAHVCTHTFLCDVQ